MAAASAAPRADGRWRGRGFAAGAGRVLRPALLLALAPVSLHPLLPGLAAEAASSGAPGRPAGKKTLQDDPAFEEKNFQRNVEEDPGCDREPLWGAFRRDLLAMPQETRIDLAFAKMTEWGLENTTKIDEQAKVCIIGVVMIQYLFAQYLLVEAGSVEAAAHSFRMMDGQAGSIHPDLFDKATGHGRTWPLTANDVDSMRRSLLRASTGGGTGGPDRRRRFRNAFGLHDGDWREIWGSWRPGGEPPATVGAKGFGAAREGAPRPSFRVYVYDPDSNAALRELARGAAFCKHNQWGMEIALHDWFLSCPCRTDNPDEADFFFVPHYTSCLINHADTFVGCDTKQLCEPSGRLFQQVLGNSSHYKRTDGGRDHVFVWGSGMGADGPFPKWREWVPNAVFLMTEPELWNPYDDVVLPSFTPHKDIIVPGRLTVDDMLGLGRMAKPLAERQALGHFIGWPRPPHPSVMAKEDCKDASCPLNVRSVLLAMKDVEPDHHVDVDVPYMESFLGLTSSVFCYVPRGKSGWSSRFFQTYFAGCVPVLLNDLYEPPFGEIVNVRKSTIKWPMAEVPALVDYLRRLRDQSPEYIERMRKAGEELRCWYAWPPSWVEFQWLEVNKSKFNVTCSTWHVRNAYVAVTRLLATRATSSRHRFYFPGINAEAQELPGALGIGRR
eukprot:TRINITY_DN25772_c0_g1_i1.p1 TRINITY_DN25772_c0_g1~~TRINITY_DN25772_c0_g1_i1.p1  ORF type:complete len:728 (-),score=166.66 TRINITY_DN25772_c0_g1_i1:70-2073(-)